MTLDYIIDFFCKKRNVRKDVLFSKYKGLTESLTRYQIWYYLHCRMGYTASRICRLFHRNIPSVFRGIRIARQHIEIYKDVRSDYERLVKEMEDAFDGAPSDI